MWYYLQIACRIVRAKTGWAMQNSTGWQVGWVETAANVCFFANCIRSDNPGPDFEPVTTQITLGILGGEEIVPKITPQATLYNTRDRF